MAKKKKGRGSRKGDWIEDASSLGNNPFAALGNPKASPNANPTPKPKPTPAAAAGPARAVVRHERKGRGGKTVTIVTHLGLSPSDLVVWCKAMKKKLGCGGQVEGENLVFNGDLRDRVATILEARGVRRVTQG